MVARLLGAAAVLGPLLALSPVPALADGVVPAPRIAVGGDRTVDGDLFLAGSSVDFAATVTGSLFVSGGTVNVSGTVGRDLVVAGGTVTVPGEVRGSVRAVGSSVTLMGPVGGDVVAGGGSLELSLGAVIAGDAVLRGDAAIVAGTIGRELTATARSLTLRGHVAEGVSAEAGIVRLEDGSSVGGDLAYASDRAASIAQGATVAGRVERIPFQAQPARGAGALSGLLSALPGLVGLYLAGLAVASVRPALAHRPLALAAAVVRMGRRRRAALMATIPIALPVLFAAAMLAGDAWLAVATAALCAAAGAGYLLAGLATGRHVAATLRRPAV